jgi:amino acid transporter
MSGLSFVLLSLMLCLMVFFVSVWAAMTLSKSLPPLKLWSLSGSDIRRLAIVLIILIVFWVLFDLFVELFHLPSLLVDSIPGGIFAVFAYNVFYIVRKHNPKAQKNLNDSIKG